jgi:putative endonuclease
LFGLVLNRKKLLADNKLLGRWGERRCEIFLKKQGLRRLANNYTCKAGEIDLIMVDGSGAIVFVEVKTRTNEDFEAVESVITQTKKDKLTRVARYFLAANEIANRPCRFDIVTIVLGEAGPVQIRHYKNAFIP